ncbi:HNH endonuclease [Nocardia sp. NPDC004260]
MPRAPRKCPKPGCENRITNSTYCEDHTQHGWVNGGRTRTTTPEHREFRRDVLQRDDYTCQLCGHRDPTGKTVQADEIIPVSRGGTPTLANGQCLCIPCHKGKTQTESAAGRRGG